MAAENFNITASILSRKPFPWGPGVRLSCENSHTECDTVVNSKHGDKMRYAA